MRPPAPGGQQPRHAPTTSNAPTSGWRPLVNSSLQEAPKGSVWLRSLPARGVSHTYS